MDIEELVSNIARQQIVSETEVRTKVAVPILNLLGHPDAYRAEEFPIFGFDGRRKLNTKFADIICFDRGEFNQHRTTDERNWVKEHSLLVIELKKPAESMDAEGQAQFYAMWARSPFYMITNGTELALYAVEQFTDDTILLQCDIQSLPIYWSKVSDLIHWDNIQKRKEREQWALSDRPYDDYVQATLFRLERELEYSLKRTMSMAPVGSYLNFPMTLSGELGDEPVAKASYKSLIESNDSVVILSEPGGGKSHLLRMICRDVLRRAITDQTGCIPIQLAARLWKRTFSNIVEGIYRELEPYCSSLTFMQVEEHLRKSRFILVVDGLDEVAEGVDTLYDELLKLSRTGIRIVATCRTTNYHQELREKLSCCSLDVLTDDQINEFALKTLGDAGAHFRYQIGAQLTTLVRNPLFLFMTVQVIKSSPKGNLPSNKAELYRSYIRFLLLDWSKVKGLPKSLSFDLPTMQKMLATYASRTFRNIGDDVAFGEIISSYFDRTSVPKVHDELLNSGLIVEGKYGPEFYHSTFHEYFVAFFYAYETKENLETFIDQWHNDESHVEIFSFLAGLLRDDSRQSLLLDYLEEHNLPLFQRCLASRFDRSELLETVWSGQFTKQYFQQVLSSYLRVIKSHFAALRTSFHPWFGKMLNEEVDADQFDVAIEGSLNPDIPAISYNYSLIQADSNSQRVNVQPFQGSPTISLVGNHGMPAFTPISLATGDGHMFHDLNQSGWGIDSAREVAFLSVKNQLKGLIDKRLTFFADTHALACEYVEQELIGFRSAIFAPFPKDLVGLSLYTHSMQEILSVMQQYSNVRGFKLPNGHVKEVNFALILYYLFRMRDENVDPKEFLLPGPDQDSASIPLGQRYEWSAWSEEQLALRIERFYDYYQQSYRQIVECCFPTLKGNLYFYRVGPVRFKATIYKPFDNARLFRSYVDLTWEPIADGEPTRPTVIITETEPVRGSEQQMKEFERLRGQLRNLGRSSQRISTGGGSLLSMYLNTDTFLGDTVYKQLVSDLTDILGKL